MKKYWYLSAGSAFLFAGSPLLFSMLAYQNQKIVKYQSTTQESAEILDFDKLIREASESALKVFVPGAEARINSIDTSNLKYENLEVLQSGEVSRTNDAQGFFFGETIFSNTTDTSQEMKTNVYEKTIENSVTNAVTYGFSTAIKAKFFFLENELTFSFNETTSTTKTTKITSKSPEQTFTIPPFSKYKVTTFLGKNTSKVNVNLNADVSGDIKIKVDGAAVTEVLIPIHVAFATLTKLPKGISLNPSQEKVHFQGVGYATSIEQNDLFSVKAEKIE